MTKEENIIKKLPHEVIARVAAGEVIEHPASVVKELIENALDAKATKINVDIDNLGLDKIVVSDNGKGMSKKDLEQCYLQHTTSKISHIDELENINSFGFRGEALFSIAAISDTTIKTKRENAIAGHEININEGVSTKIKPVGMPEGTIIKVEQLFKNLPARKSFFENRQHELKRIIQVVTEAALSKPEIAFSLKINGKIQLLVPEKQSLFERIKYLLGENTVKNLLPLEHEEENLNISGYISTPQGALSTRDLQYIFVNGRPVSNLEIPRVIKTSFGTLIDIKTHPVMVLNIKTEPHMLDINIHPRKREVMFINKEKILESLSSITKQKLGLEDLTYQIQDADTDDFESFLKQSSNKEIRNNKKGNPYLARVLKESTNVWNIKTNSIDKENDIIQLENLYLVTTTSKGLIIIDQHAAHERILYEEFLKGFEDAKETKDLLEKHEIIDVPIAFVPLIKANIETLEKVGIYLEHFRNNTFKLNRILKVFEKHNMQKLLIEVLEDVENVGASMETDDYSLKTISYLACRSAIKAGDYLTKKERKNLIEKLELTKTNYTCPHGRPVKLDLSMSELGKMFKRVK